MPLIVVVMITVGQVTCCKQRPVQVGGMPQVLSVSPPQVSGCLHNGQCRRPPQPSAIGPHAFAPMPAQVFGVHCAQDEQYFARPVQGLIPHRFNARG